MADAVRVALLAKAGDARNQLRQALNDLGADLVAEGDPNELDPQSVTERHPKLVLVSLEPAIELGLERFDDLLSASNVEVIYDDAEVTSGLSGWDLNRWARHLAAKMLGRDLLPPAPKNAEAIEDKDLQPTPGAVPTPAQLMADEKLEDYTRDTHEMALFVPSSDTLTAPLEPSAPSAPVIEDSMPTIEEATFVAPTVEAKTQEPAAEDFQFDVADIEQAMQRMEFAQQEGGVAKPLAADPADELLAGSTLSLEGDLLEGFDDAALAAEVDFNAGDDLQATSEIRFSGFDADTETTYDGSLDADIADLAAQLEQFEKTDRREAPRDLNFTAMQEQTPAAPSAAPASSAAPPLAAAVPAASESASERKPKFDFSALSLADDHAPPSAPAAVEAARTTREFDLSKLSLADDGLSSSASAEPVAASEQRPTTSVSAAPIAASLGASLSLVADPVDSSPNDVVASTPVSVSASPMTSSASSSPVLMLLAGLGGPDAVRQVLSHLRIDSQAIVLVQQHLEVGSYDRLANQFGKVAKLPVQLAVEGSTALPGHCYILPDGMSLAAAGALRFVAGDAADTLANLPAERTHLLVTSGADARWIDAIQSFLQRGGDVRVQDPAECFEPATARELQEAGVAACAPRDWPAQTGH